MVTLRSWDEEHGFTDGPSSTTARAAHRYLVTLTSEEEVTTHEVEWPPEIAAAVSALAKAVNEKATWSCSPRMHVNALDSAAPQGEVA